MTLKRLGAFIAAVVLIVGAVLLRNSLDDNSSSATDATDRPSGGRPTVVCSTEFRAVCNSLDAKRYDVSIESAGVTLDRLAKDGAQPPDAWITLDPFPGMVDVLRRVSSLTGLSPQVLPLATDTPLVAVLNERQDAISAICGTSPVWSCIGTSAGQSWTKLAPGSSSGTFLPGITDPVKEAGGLLTFATAVSGFVGSVPSSSATWKNNTSFNTWMRNFSAHRTIVTDTTPLARMLVRKTQVDVAAMSESERASASASNLAKISIITVDPTIQLVAVVATFSNRSPALATTVTPLLVAARWTAVTKPAPTLDAGTFVALRSLWKDNNR